MSFFARLSLSEHCCAGSTTQHNPIDYNITSNNIQLHPITSNNWIYLAGFTRTGQSVSIICSWLLLDVERPWVTGLWLCAQSFQTRPTVQATTSSFSTASSSSESQILRKCLQLFRMNVVCPCLSQDFTMRFCDPLTPQSFAPRR